MRINLIKWFIWLFVFVCSSSEGAGDNGESVMEETTHAYHLGIEKFEAKGRYEITLKKEKDEARKALKALEKLREEHDSINITSSKSAAEKDRIYFTLAEMLPAGTVFRVRRAHDDEDGNTNITIESKEELERNTLLSNSDILSFEKAEAVLYAPRDITIAPDASTKNLPKNWDKEKGYQTIRRILFSGTETIKVSVVFHNPNNHKTYWHLSPYAGVIDSLKVNRKGRMYGLGYSDDELAWWTQDIDLEQLKQLYENELVVNLIPRKQGS